ncbi:hypothetical protein HOP50_19g83870 [Chloropicon primus]|uniref:Uncharacterized protein n=1 Tax=Chloropicon primus TaxID=1764295 RepID=A0A5B8N1T1_9CHLO|nr:hypothetical protein A3770_19p83630 [Chloropicon primus]UPR05040.1 hypothetical protein HOP50_19g83870 [Chloropicon primus]|eukprot:QDZ25845.1 hypothetical protein A3770_19p83630 [Chloropicon primus]
MSAQQKKKLKHKSSEVGYPAACHPDDDVVVDLSDGQNNGGSFTSRSFPSTRGLLFQQTKHQNHQSPRRRSPASLSRRSVCAAFSAGGVLGALLVIELMVVIAFTAGPLVGSLKSLQKVLDSFAPEAEPKVRLMLNIDTGGNLTGLLGDPTSLMAAGAQLLAPAGRTASVASVPEDTTPAPTSSSPDVEPRGSEFYEWCRRAECIKGGLGGEVELRSKCTKLDLDLLTAQNDGRPVIPLPQAYCGALSDLSSSGCLCEGSGLSLVSSDTERLVQMAQVSGAMCGLTGIRSGASC